MNAQNKATKFEAGKKYFAPGLSKGEFDVIEVLKVTAKTVFFIDKYGEKTSKRIVLNNDCQTFEHIFGKFTPEQEATEEFEAARKIASQIRRDKIAKETAARHEKQRLTAYRIVKADGRIKFTGTERGSWFTLKGAMELVDRVAGEKILYCDCVSGLYCEILPGEESEVVVAEPEIEGLDEAVGDAEPEGEVSLIHELKNEDNEASGLNLEEQACEKCDVKIGDVIRSSVEINRQDLRVKTIETVKHVFDSELKLKEYFEQDCIARASICNAFLLYDWKLSFHCPIWHYIGDEKLWLSFDDKNKVYLVTSFSEEVNKEDVEDRAVEKAKFIPIAMELGAKAYKDGKKGPACHDVNFNAMMETVRFKSLNLQDDYACGWMDEQHREMQVQLEQLKRRKADGEAIG